MTILIVIAVFALLFSFFAICIACDETTVVHEYRGYATPLDRFYSQCPPYPSLDFSYQRGYECGLQDTRYGLGCDYPYKIKTNREMYNDLRIIQRDIADIRQTLNEEKK